MIPRPYEDELRYRWSLILPQMKTAVRRAAMEARPINHPKPLKVGSLPNKGMPQQPSYAVR